MMLLFLLFDAIVPGIMMLGGWLMWKHMPRDINGLIGYRTGRSMKNQDTWKFANEYCGRMWWRLGSYMLPISLAVQLAFFPGG